MPGILDMESYLANAAHFPDGEIAHKIENGRHLWWDGALPIWLIAVRANLQPDDKPSLR